METEKLSDKYKASGSGSGEDKEGENKNPAPSPAPTPASSQPIAQGGGTNNKVSSTPPVSLNRPQAPAPVGISLSYIQRLKTESRENVMIIILGETGVGKSYSIIELARGYAKDNPITGKKARIVYIFDTNGEPEFAQAFPNAITPKQIMSVTRPDVYRVLPIKDNGDIMNDEEIQEAMIYIAKNGRRCAMFFDDIDSYFEGAKPRTLSRLFMGFRHRGGRDVVFIHQRWSVILPKERAGAKYISLRHTSESVELTKGRWKNPELLMIAENIVEEQYDLAEASYIQNKISKEEYKIRRSFWVDIDTRLNRIIGGYSKKCFIRNCRKYLNANPNIISQFQRINCDRNGDSLYDREQAIEGVIKTRLWRYFAGKE